MNKLPPSAAGLLEQARQRDRAHQVDLDATLRDLHAVLPFAAGPVSVAGSEQAVDFAGDAASLGQPPPSLSPPSLPAPAGVEALASGALLGGKAVKVFLATVALGGAVGGARLMGAPARQADSRAREVPVQEAPRVPQVPHAAPPHVEQAVTGEPTADAPQRVGTSAVAGGKVRGPRAQSKAVAPSVQALTSVVPPSSEPQAAAAAPTSAVRPHAIGLSESELDLIDAALAQLRAGSGAGALAWVERHATLYPRGRFLTEREALRVLALCESGRIVEGRSAQQRFLRDAGGAPIAAQVRAACTDKGPR